MNKYDVWSSNSVLVYNNILSLSTELFSATLFVLFYQFNPYTIKND